MRVVVTGAGGFIGRAACRSLHEAGHELVVLSRDAAPRDALEGAGAVLHLAGENVAARWTPRKRRAIAASRIEGTRRLVEGMRVAKSPPALLLSASAVGYYGDRGEETLTETSPPGEGFLAEVCRGWETAAMRARDAGTRVTCLRFGIVLGADGGALAPQAKAYRLGLGGALGSGRQWWPWVHRADLVGVILHLLDRPLDGALNVVSPAPVRQSEWAAELARLLRRPAVIRAPAWALRLALGGLAAEVLGSRLVVPARLKQAGFSFRFPRLADALEDILAGRASPR